MIRDAGTVIRSSPTAAGLLLVLALLPSAAHAECNQASSRADYGDYAGYVPVSRHAKHDSRKPHDRKLAALVNSPEKPPPSQGRCWHAAHRNYGSWGQAHTCSCDVIN
jgi:hypothetical protein